MMLMLFQLTLSLAGNISQQLAALQCLHLICLLPQLCTKKTNRQVSSVQDISFCSIMAYIK